MSEKTTEPQLLNQREYAAHRGVSQPAVSKAMRTKRLKRSIVLRGKRRLIDPAIADIEWNANTDPAARGGTEGIQRKKASKKKATRREPVHEQKQPEPESEPEDYHEAKSRRESALADLAELDRDEKERRLVAADEQRRDAFRCARLVRDAILNIPDRVAAQVAAITDPHEVHAILKGEIVDSLRGLADIEREQLAEESVA